MPNASDYDPVKAHEYYMRTRKLKGRRSVAQTPTLNKSPSSSLTVSSKNKSVQANKKAQPQKISSVNAKKVAELKVRLEKLRAELKDLKLKIKAAKAGLSKEAKASLEAGSGKTTVPRRKRTEAEKLTAAEKRKAAKASKEWYEKNKQEEALVEQIKDAEKAISNAKEKLKAILDARRR